MFKRHGVWIAICAMSFLVTPCYAGTWVATDGYYIAQDDEGWSEVLPGEDMDGHDITWGGGTVLFYPSWESTPQPGDELCWLYGPTTWWKGVFVSPSDNVYIQLRGCDNNDGYADIYVDGAYEFSWCTYNKNSVLIEGRNLPFTAHTVEIRTRSDQTGCHPPDDDVSIDYVAAAGRDEYALLICGDTPHTAYQAYMEGRGGWSGTPGVDSPLLGFDEFWGDVNWLYNILIERTSLTPDRVFVLWGDGQDWTVTHPSEVCCRYWPSHGTVTDFSATVDTLRMVLHGLQTGDPALGIPRMTPEDRLYVYTFDHGSTGPGPDGDQWGDAELCLMDGNITDVEFAARLDSIPYAERTVFMQQCFSGGFIDDLTTVPHNLKTCVYAACRGDECAWRADDLNPNPDLVENETCPDCGIHVNHGEFNYYFMSAHYGASPLGTAVNANTELPNHWISSYEAGQWAMNHNSTWATFQSKDDGNVGHSWILTWFYNAPTLSQWGLLALGLLLVAAATITISRRRRTKGIVTG